MSECEGERKPGKNIFTHEIIHCVSSSFLFLLADFNFGRRDFPCPSGPTMWPVCPPPQWVPAVFPGVNLPGCAVDHPPHLFQDLKST